MSIFSDFTNLFGNTSKKENNEKEKIITSQEIKDMVRVRKEVEEKTEISQKSIITKLYSLEQLVNILKIEYPKKYEEFSNKIDTLRVDYEKVLEESKKSLTFQINPNKDSKKISVKDRNNLLTGNQWTCGEQLNNFTGFTYTYGPTHYKITDEYENIGEYGYTGIIIENGKGKIINRDNTETILTLSNNKSIKARLPNYSEINKAGCTGTNRSCPTWLVQNLKNVNIPKYESTQKIEGISGYWLLSSRKDTSGLAYFVNCYGNEYYNVGVSHGYSFGARPVITITIDELSN